MLSIEEIRATVVTIDEHLHRAYIKAGVLEGLASQIKDLPATADALKTLDEQLSKAHDLNLRLRQKIDRSTMRAHLETCDGNHGPDDARYRLADDVTQVAAKT